jgi:hypothetical protein
MAKKKNSLEDLMKSSMAIGMGSAILGKVEGQVNPQVSMTKGYNLLGVVPTIQASGLIFDTLEKSTKKMKKI